MITYVCDSTFSPMNQVQSKSIFMRRLLIA